MSNDDIFNKIVEKYGEKEIIKFCDVISMVFNEKYHEVEEYYPLSEYDFERKWWTEKYKNLIKKKNERKRHIK